MADLTLEVAQSHAEAPHQTGHSRKAVQSVAKYDENQTRGDDGRWVKEIGVHETSTKTYKTAIGIIHNGVVRVRDLHERDPYDYDHQEIWRTEVAASARFRFNRGRIEWLDNPHADDYFAVDDHFAAKGWRIKGHYGQTTGNLIPAPKPKVAKDTAFDESKHPRHPAGSGDKGGEFAAAAARSSPALAEEAKVGITAVEKLLPEAIKTADYKNVQGRWDDLPEATKQAAKAYYKKNVHQYEAIDVNAIERKLDDEVRVDLYKNHAPELVQKAKGWLKGELGDDPVDEFAPGAEKSGGKPLDYATVNVPDPHRYVGGDYPVLDVNALRHTDGTELTPFEKNHVNGLWKSQFAFAVQDEVQIAQGTEEYANKKDAAVDAEAERRWEKFFAKEPLIPEMISQGLFAGVDNPYGSVPDGEPDQWVTGIETETGSKNPDYGRTHALAIKLTELRTDELRKERGLMGPGVKPPYTIAEEVDPLGRNSLYYRAFDEVGHVIATGGSKEIVTTLADAWAKDVEIGASRIKTQKLIEDVWRDWKQDSSEGLALSLQVAVAREFDGLHRLTPEEVENAEAHAEPYGGIDTLQAYARAQWEVTQLVMARAKQDKVNVYRGLMLDPMKVNGTTNVFIGKDGLPLEPPHNIKVKENQTNWAGDKKLVTLISFEYNGEDFVAERQRVPLKGILEAGPQEWNDVEPFTKKAVLDQWMKDASKIPDAKDPVTNYKLYNKLSDPAKFAMLAEYVKKGLVIEHIPPPRPWETTEDTIQRRLDIYHKSADGRNILVKLPDMVIRRAGAQSTTGTLMVANDWAGVGKVPDGAVRVVLRVEAPPTSVLSLPVFGVNIQEEHESVLIGTKDRWIWDAWRRKAPAFKDVPMVRPKLTQKAEKESLIIDLQAEDRGKPHWMSSVDWTAVQSSAGKPMTYEQVLKGRVKPTYERVLKYSESQLRHPKGHGRESGRFAKGGAGLGLADIAPDYRSFPSQADSQAYEKKRRALRQLGTNGATSVPPGMVGDTSQGRRYAGALSGSATTVARGLGNAPRITGDPEMVKRLTTPPPLPPLSEPKVLGVMKTAKVIRSEEIPGGHANKAFTVTLNDAKAQKAVLKPEKGERWKAEFANTDIPKFIKNRQFSLAEREASAYEVSAMLRVGLVPETIHRETVEGFKFGPRDSSEDESESSGRPDSEEVRRRYDSYREGAQEDAYERAAEGMGELWSQNVHNAEKTSNEIKELWDKIAAEPEFADRIANAEVMREHPTLPMGSMQPFERKDPDEVDMNEVMNEADINHDEGAGLTGAEEERVEAIIRKRLEEGAEKIGDFDDSAYNDDHYDDWLQSHQDTENRLIDENIQSFSRWKASQGIQSSSSHWGRPAQPSVLNPDAPHPEGASLQKFVDGFTEWGDYGPEEARKFAVLDYVIGSMDRHGRNVAYDGDGMVMAIDNGYAFPETNGIDDFAFRSDPVAKARGGYYGDKDDLIMPETERKRTLMAIEQADWKGFVERHPNMAKGERDSLLARVERMKLALKTADGLKKLWKNLEMA